MEAGSYHAVEIHGFCEDRFKPLEEAFRANFDDGLELGASLGVTHHGRMVVDLWAGSKDGEQTQPWEKDTIVLVASTTKIMTSLAALILVDRGLLDLDAPIVLLAGVCARRQGRGHRPRRLHPPGRGARVRSAGLDRGPV